MTTTHTPGPYKCPKCGGKSRMNGYCLTCEWKQANAQNNEQDGSLLAHCYASLDAGFDNASNRAAIAKAEGR